MIGLFLAAGVLSLASSWLLVSRLARLGAALGLSEALLGMVAALAADAPEITAATTALVRHEHAVGTGVVVGSNVFNLAALLGLAALVAGEIRLHRRVVALGGTVAVAIAAVTVLVVAGGVSPRLGLVVVAAALAPLLVVLGSRRERTLHRLLPAAAAAWLIAAAREEELELEPALHPRRGTAADAATALAATLVVVGASVGLEWSATRIGTADAVPAAVVGGLVLAALTSLPNAVAAVYFAARGRGAATLSTALNSNAINIAFGLLLPGAIVGLGRASGEASFAAAAYLALTVFALGWAYAAGGLRRPLGAAIVAVYLAYAAILVVTS